MATYDSRQVIYHPEGIHFVIMTGLLYIIPLITQLNKKYINKQMDIKYHSLSCEKQETAEWHNPWILHHNNAGDALNGTIMVDYIV